MIGMVFESGTVVGLLALIATIDMAQFAHQLVLARRVGQNTARIKGMVDP